MNSEERSDERVWGPRSEEASMLIRKHILSWWELNPQHSESPRSGSNSSVFLILAFWRNSAYLMKWCISTGIISFYSDTSNAISWCSLLMGCIMCWQCPVRMAKSLVFRILEITSLRHSKEAFLLQAWRVSDNTFFMLMPGHTSWYTKISVFGTHARLKFNSLLTTQSNS